VDPTIERREMRNEGFLMGELMWMLMWMCERERERKRRNYEIESRN